MIAAIRRMLMMIQGSRLSREELATLIKTYDFRIALAALLVHAGTVDGAFVEAEKRLVRVLLVEQLGISPVDASELMMLVNYSHLQSQEIDELTGALALSLGHEGRVHFVECLWQVVVADTVVTAEENSLIAALASKLGIDAAGQAAIAARHAAGFAR